MRINKRFLATLICLTVFLCTMITGTIAWLTDETAPVINTFTPSNIDIELTETKGGDGKTFKMVPGAKIEKDPKVTVKAGSEACYVFVKFEKTNGFDSFMEYTVADGWTELTADSGIYYREVATSAENQECSVLKDNVVTVLGSVTKAQMDALSDSSKYPTLTFTAYACQMEGFDTAADAWAEIE